MNEPSSSSGTNPANQSCSGSSLSTGLYRQTAHYSRSDISDGEGCRNCDPWFVAHEFTQVIAHPRRDIDPCVGVFAGRVVTLVGVIAGRTGIFASSIVALIGVFAGRINALADVVLGSV